MKVIGFKHIGVMVTIILALIAGVSGYGKLQANQANNKEKIEEVKKEVEKVEGNVDDTKEKLFEEEKVNVKQTVMLEQISMTLNKLNEKLDKDISK